MLEMALKYARAGMAVFPCQPGDKTPIYVPGGHRLKWGGVATTDEATITDWWTAKCQTANIGVAAKPSRLLVVDCDQFKTEARPPGFEDCSSGEDAYALICESVGYPVPFNTLTVTTPSLGKHYYYRNPANVQLRNSSLLRGAVDIRANGGSDGGYVVGAGSVRADGARYEVSYNAPVAPAPDWLLELCTEPPTPPRPAVPATRPAGSFNRFEGSPKFDGLINSVRYAQEGGRNAKLHWAACAAAKDGMTLDEALRDLRAAAMECGLSDSEIEPTIRSAYRGMGK